MTYTVRPDAASNGPSRSASFAEASVMPLPDGARWRVVPCLGLRRPAFETPMVVVSGTGPLHAVQPLSLPHWARGWLTLWEPSLQGVLRPKRPCSLRLASPTLSRYWLAECMDRAFLDGDGGRGTLRPNARSWSAAWLASPGGPIATDGSWCSPWIERIPVPIGPEAAGAAIAQAGLRRYVRTFAEGGLCDPIMLGAAWLAGPGGDPEAINRWKRLFPAFALEAGITLPPAIRAVLDALAGGGCQIAELPLPEFEVFSDPPDLAHPRAEAAWALLAWARSRSLEALDLSWRTEVLERGVGLGPFAAHRAAREADPFAHLPDAAARSRWAVAATWIHRVRPETSLPDRMRGALGVLGSDPSQRDLDRALIQAASDYQALWERVHEARSLAEDADTGLLRYWEFLRRHDLSPLEEAYA